MSNDQSFKNRKPGMVTLPQVFASAEALYSSSFFSSKVFWVASSWLKTLMTF